MAIALLGGNVSTAAVAMGLTYQAVHKWPEQLTEVVERQVIAVVAWQDPVCRQRLLRLGFTAPPPNQAAIPPQLRDL